MVVEAGLESRACSSVTGGVSVTAVDDLDARLAQLDAAGRLAGAAATTPADGETLSTPACAARRRQFFLAGGDDLDDAPAVAHDQEADAAEAAQRRAASPPRERSPTCAATSTEGMRALDDVAKDDDNSVVDMDYSCGCFVRPAIRCFGKNARGRPATQVYLRRLPPDWRLRYRRHHPSRTSLPAPPRRREGRTKRIQKALILTTFGGRGLTRRLVVPPPFAPLRITDAEPLLCALTGASRRRLLSASLGAGSPGGSGRSCQAGPRRRSQHTRRSLYRWRQPDVSHHSRMEALYHTARELSSGRVGAAGLLDTEMAMC